MSETYLSPNTEQMKALIGLSVEGPIVMLNLLKFRPDGGAEDYAEYGRLARPFLERAGVSLRYLGDVAATVIGGEEWDEVILVEYPSKQAFLEMTGDPDYPSEARGDSLLDSRLYCMQDRAS
ncbi:MAG: hypothetical protein ACI9ON_001267 [Limisphaerales bacterium]